MTRDRVLLAATVLLAAVLRLVGLDRQGFWTDELYVVWEARQPLNLIFDPGLHIHHPPGYRLALHIWAGLGLAESWLRLLPALAGLLLVPVGWRLARELWPTHPQAAHVAALLLATSPFLLHYSQDVTAYSWTALWITGSMLLLVLAWRRDSARLWAAWAFSLAGALYSHYFSLFPLLFELLAVLALAVAGRRSRQEELPGSGGPPSGTRSRLAHALLALAGAALLYAPWVFTLLARAGDRLSVFLFPLTVDRQPLEWVAILLVGYGNAGFWRGAGGLQLAWLLLGAAALCGAWRLARARSARKAVPLLLLGGWALAAISGPYIFLRLTTPPEAVDPVRFGAFAAPALLLALGAAIASLPAPARLLALAGWLALAGVQWRAELISPPAQDWRGMLAHVAVGARQGDVLLAFPAFHAASAASYYQVPMPVRGGWIVQWSGGGESLDTAYWFPPDWRYQGFYNRHAYASDAWDHELKLRAGDARRVWYLAGDGVTDGTYPRSPQLEQAFAAAGFQQAGEWRAPPLLLKLYAR